MKVLDASAGLLTNFEVLEVLKERGTRTEADESGVPGPATPSEQKVHDYLVHSPAGTQTRKSIQTFTEAIKELELLKAEKLQMVNLRPSIPVEVHLVVEDCDERLTTDAVEALIATVDETLPPAPEAAGPTEDEAT
ncbi:DNA-directed RNA polymerase II subunit 4 [Klebsormidium nitens]|uniref:DNA-directed RNA polymerase III subunit RPC9 n=1 Tax=Klebsormidium nitens TaxID=105231 RepID=A0A1Y1I594_KLENI|nr:DNA-directed RNA polymerase II subunit 4 [Klebsormidium nitens]|eukprot:GAQ86120.1 DNA-directed RNA polymerase II subunit 4 [Klebsormidium nitens]